ncbi:MAG: hypothetical protein ACFE9T_04985 [Promethearchaeota archaeon]
MIKNLVQTQNKDLKFKFFNTTYYDISSLSKALSYCLNKMINLEKINSELKAVEVNFNCNPLILYTNEGLILYDYYYDAMDIREFEEIITSKINEHLEFFQRLEDEEVKIDERVTFSKEYTEYVKKFDVLINNEVNTFYIGILTPLENIIELKKELEKFQVIL